MNCSTAAIHLWEVP